MAVLRIGLRSPTKWWSPVLRGTGRSIYGRGYAIEICASEDTSGLSVVGSVTVSVLYWFLQATCGKDRRTVTCDPCTSESNETLLSGDDAQQIYLEHSKVLIMNAEHGDKVQLENDVQRPTFLEAKELATMNLWMNNARSRSSTHYDPHHNLLCIVAGQKQGDALFIPEGWFHQVDSDDLTIAVNFWWQSDIMSSILTEKEMQKISRTLEALILHLLSPVGAEAVTQKFDEMDQQTAEEDRNKFYKVFYSASDDQFAAVDAMDAILDGKEKFACQKFSAQLQKEILSSDMLAFKAANPDAVFEDFIRRHSPGD